MEADPARLERILANLLNNAATGYTPSEADNQRRQQTGFDHYFVKPVNLETLLELFKTVVKQPAIQDQDCESA